MNFNMNQMTERIIIEKQAIMIEQQAAIIEAQGHRIVILEAEVADLKRRLDSNSKNSDKPPSSEVFRKPQSLRVKGGKKGAPKGHKGYTLQATKTPDYEILHRLHKCTNCNCNLDHIEPKIEKRQVFELPTMSLKVTEHQAENKKCSSCGHINKAEFPEEVTAPVQYGNMYKSFLTYLNIHHHIPLKRIEQLSKDLFGQSMTSASIIEHNRRLCALLKEPEEQIRQDLINSHSIHADESGVRVDNTLKWIHVASDSQSTLYNIHDKRGAEGINELGVLQHREGIVVHDCWSSYFNEEYEYEHALCGVHLLRECQGIMDHDEQNWAKLMFDLLQKACHMTNEARKVNKPLEESEIKKIELEYDEIVNTGLPIASAVVFSAEKKSKKGRKALNLLSRLQIYKIAILRFIHDLEVPFTNNQAEQDIRMIKVKQKVSGSFRTMEGATIFACIRGFVSTVRKRQLNILDSLTHAIKKQFSFSN